MCVLVSFRHLRHFYDVNKQSNDIAQSTELLKLRQFAETFEARVSSHCCTLTPTLLHDVMYELCTRWLRGRKFSVRC